MSPRPATPRHHHVGGWLLVVVQLVLLAGLVLLPGGDRWDLAGWARTVLLVVQSLGLAVVAVGLLGLGPVVTATPVPVGHTELRTGGLYRFVRHPVYTGLLVFAWANALASGSVAQVLLAAALTALLAGKARWEERMLTAAHPDYADYAGRTGRFLPRLPGTSPGRRRPAR